MAHQPTLRRDPFQRSQPADEQTSPRISQPKWVEDSAEVYLEELAATLAAHGGGASSTDLALDLVLNEIVEQARQATGGAGAAIALIRGDEMVCRATTGAHAPELGVRLNMSSGLSGACIQTQQAQRSEDTESDPRVDAASCRLLEVRSILIVPVLQQEKLLGVIETLSPRAQAFDDHDTETLQLLSRRIVDNIQRAAEAAAAPLAVAPPSATGSVHQDQSELPAPPTIVQPEARETRPRDHWTGALTVVVIGLALWLGWTVGGDGWRAAWRAASSVANPQLGVSSPGSESKHEPIGAASKSAPSTTSSADARPARPATGKLVGSPAPGVSKTNGAEIERRTDAPAAGSLIVYEKGKVIFQVAPSEVSHQPATGLTPRTAMRNATPKGNEDPATNPSPISAQPASAYLIHRVEPQYPGQAREQHIQGPVVLKALVGKDGTVEMLKVVSGDPQLVSAAGDAVRQWRFKPYRLHGQPVEFETQITVNFSLP
jgi:TonB family protein